MQAAPNSGLLAASIFISNSLPTQWPMLQQRMQCAALRIAVNLRSQSDYLSLDTCASDSVIAL
jgi:hypothetical protein